MRGSLKQLLSRRNLALIVLGLIVIASAAASWTKIRSMSPYPRHWDEQKIAGRAAKILKTGDLNPHFFRYPSLPIYITAAAFIGGLVDAASHLEVESTDDIGKVGFPHYDQPRLFVWAHGMLVVVGLIGMVLAGALARAVGGKEELLFLTPLIMCFSSLYIFQSTYLNVDIFGACAVLLNLLVLVSAIRGARLDKLPVVPGILVGVATACKYNLVLIAVSWVTAYLLTDIRRSARQLAVLLVVALLSFLIATPFALLDLSSFLSDVLKEIHHYKSGHKWFENEAGFAQLLYYGGKLTEDYGLVVPLLALIGIGHTLRTRRRELSCILAFVIVYTGFMSLQQTSFIRNLLAIFVLVAVFAAAGAFELGAWLRKLLAQRGWIRLCWAGPAMVAVLVLVTIPWSRISESYSVVTDSRLLALDWLEEHAAGKTVYVPERLGFDARPLGNRVKVETYDMEETAQLLNRVGSSDALLIVGSFDYSRRFGVDDRVLEYRRLTGELPVIVELGERPIFLNYFTPVPRGNPAFAITRAQLSRDR
jgi:hypothetical protein